MADKIDTNKTFHHMPAAYSNRFYVTTYQEGLMVVFGESAKGQADGEHLHTRVFIPHAAAVQIGPILTNIYAKIEADQNQTKNWATLNRTEWTMRWFERHRQEWIAETLHVFGYINRAHIERKFGVSTPQASHDLHEFQRLNPGKIIYDKNAKRYSLNSHNGSGLWQNTSTITYRRHAFMDYIPDVVRSASFAKNLVGANATLSKNSPQPKQSQLKAMNKCCSGNDQR